MKFWELKLGNRTAAGLIVSAESITVHYQCFYHFFFCYSFSNQRKGQMTYLRAGRGIIEANFSQGVTSRTCRQKEGKDFAAVANFQERFCRAK